MQKSIRNEGHMVDNFNYIKECKYTYIKRAELKKSTLISIVIPTYKRGKMLEESLYSVLQQSCDHDDVEVIVLSNDEKENFVNLISKYKRYNFSIIRNETNIGMCGNINKCLLVANGKYVAYLHDDDLLLPTYVAEIKKAINKYQNADVIIPRRYLMMGNDEWGKRMEKKQFLKNLFSKALTIFKYKQSDIYRLNVEDIYRTGRNCFNAPTCGTIFKKQSIIEFGGFDSRWKYAFDLIFYEEYCKQHEVILYKKPLGLYRMIESASNNNVVQLEFFEAQKYCLDKNKTIPWVNQYYYEYLHLFEMGLAKRTRELIENKYECETKKWSHLKYLMLRIKTQFYYYSSGIECEEYLSIKNKAVF